MHTASRDTTLIRSLTILFKTLAFRMPKNVKPGSPEEALYRMQEESLSNEERSDFQDTVLAYKEFLARNPEYIGTGAAGDRNAEQLSEYFAMHGKKFVRMNDAIVPLATSAEQWQQAYEWKLAMARWKLTHRQWKLASSSRLRRQRKQP